MKTAYKDFLIRNWEERDRTSASEVIRSVLSEYGLGWEPNGADRSGVASRRMLLSNGWRILGN